MAIDWSTWIQTVATVAALGISVSVQLEQRSQLRHRQAATLAMAFSAVNATHAALQHIWFDLQIKKFSAETAQACLDNHAFASAREALAALPIQELRHSRAIEMVDIARTAAQQAQQSLGSMATTPWVGKLIEKAGPDGGVTDHWEMMVSNASEASKALLEMRLKESVLGKYEGPTERLKRWDRRVR